MKTLAMLVAAFLIAFPSAAQMPPALREIRIEAEQGELSGGAKVMTDHRDFSGQGFVAGFENAGASVRLAIFVRETGLAKASMRYSAGYGDQVVQLYVDGRKFADLHLPGTEGWDAWKSKDIEIPLTAGYHHLEI